MKRTGGKVPEEWWNGKLWMGPLGLALVLAVFHWKVLFLGQVFAALDSSRFFFPVWKWGWGVFQQGNIPLWNPDAQFGVPYLADPQTACAYPPLWLLYLLLGPIAGFSMVIVVHHLWALWGFWFFARAQGFSSRAAFLGSLTFGFSLHLVGASWTPPALMAISWLPWVFWAAEKAFQKKPGGFLLLSLAWAMQLACGYPVLVYLTGLGLGMHFFWADARRLNHEDTKGTKEDRGGSKTKKNNSSLFLVPFVSSWFNRFFWVGIFALAAMVAACYNLAWGLPFAEMLPLTNYADGAKNFDTLGWKGIITLLLPFFHGHPFGPNDQTVPYWVTSFYMGFPVAGLLAWGMAKRSFRGTSPWILAAFLVLSLGGFGIGTALRAVFPGYSLVVHSGFWLSLFVFYGAWMAAEVLEGILQDAPKAGKWTWGVLVLTTVLFLGPAAHGLILTKERDFYRQRPARVPGNVYGRCFFSPNEMAKAIQLQGRDIQEAYENAKQSFIPNWPLAFFCEEVPFYNTLRLKHSFAWTFEVFQRSEADSREVLDYLGIRYLFGKNRFKGLEVTGGEEVFKNPTAFPTWFSVSKAYPAGSTLMGDLAGLPNGRVDLGKETFLSGITRVETFRVREVDPRLGRAQLKPIKAKGGGRTLLVSTETAYPGWKAKVYKVAPHFEERRVEVVNHAFRGVILEEGEEVVWLSFEPTTFRLGLFLSLLSGALWAGMALKGWKP